MTNQLTVNPFKFHTATIRTVMVGDEPMFVARDVALALGYSVNNLSTIVNRFCRGITKCDIPTKSGTQWITVIPGADGEPWFVATDVCKAIGTVHAPTACKNLDDDEKNTVVLNNSKQDVGGGRKGRQFN